MATWVLAVAVLLAALIALWLTRRAPPEKSLPRAAPSEPATEAAPATDAGGVLGGSEPEAIPSSRALVPVSRALQPPEPPAPIVFAHGFGGFDEIRALGVDYFRGVKHRVGERVHFTRVSPFAGVEARAAELARQLERFDGRRVHLIAHSMGGLDARYAIAMLGADRRVATLTTVGTPHRGTPLADVGARLMRRSRRLTETLIRLGLSAEALEDLSTERMVAWNERVRNAPGVRYASYVATPRRMRDVAPPLWPAYALLGALYGDNDGVVPAWSQPWGEVLGHLDADHWGAVGWSRGFDAVGFYESLVADLRASE